MKNKPIDLNEKRWSKLSKAERTKATEPARKARLDNMTETKRKKIGKMLAKARKKALNLRK